MYSVVMLAAMTAAPETPDFFFKKGNGCNGYSSCYGCNGGGGCWSNSCYGCGGGCRGFGHGWSVGSGCCGGRSSCHGCHGFATVYSSCNGYGCYGGLSLGGCISSYGPPGSGCYGNHFSPGYAQTGVGFTNGTVPYYVPTVTTPATETPEAVSALPTTRAQLVVRVPVEAKLFADGQATSLTGAERAFLTPEITAGKDFQYTLKVEHDGKTDSKQVVVRAGHRTVVDFAGTTQTSTPVTVTLPENAKLYVDGKAAAAAAGRQTFRTPELVKGKPYTYEFKAEVVVDGKTDVRTRTVTFQAGEPVSVDFTEADAVRTASR